MMKTFAWLVGGFVLLGLSGLIETIGDAGATAGERLPVYFVALAVLLGAPFCFFKAFRSAWTGIHGGKPARHVPATPRPAHRIVDGPEPAEASEFDADAAFARYMNKRSGQAEGGQPREPTPAIPQPPRPHFGRKAL